MTTLQLLDSRESGGARVARDHHGLPLALSLALGVWGVCANSACKPWHEDVEPRRGLLGFSYSYEERETSPPLGALRIDHVTPGGPAHGAGVQPGDRVVAVNDITFRFRDELEQIRAFKWVQPGDRLVLSVLRADEIVKCELTAIEMSPSHRAVLEEMERQQLIHNGHTTLEKLGRGDGIDLMMERDLSTGELEIKAKGVPRHSLEGVLAVIRQWNEQDPVSREIVDGLRPGNELKVHVTYDGSKMLFSLKEREPPPSLR